MTFVQDLLKSTFTGSSTLTDLHMNVGAPKTVTAGNSIVVWVARWGSFSLGTPFVLTDNLSNSYSTFISDYISAKFHYHFFYCNNCNGGSLTDIVCHFGGVGSVAYHVTGCAAEFTETMNGSSWGSEVLDNSTGMGTTLSSSAVTLGSALHFYAFAVGGDGQDGNISGYTAPSGWSQASDGIVPGNAPTIKLLYKYGSLSSEVITSSWTGSRWALAIHGIGGAYATPFVPQVYRVKRP